jgi:hypothetical protein
MIFMSHQMTMRFETAFRASIYAALLLASVCLAVASGSLIPEILFLLVPVTIIIILAYLHEGRWVLSSRGSNVVGIGITALTLIWAAYNLLLPTHDWAESAPWPASLLPFCGPVLMILVLGKIFRPKLLNDFWVLHLLGLMQVALACVLALEPIFLLALLAYLTVTIWSLSLYFQYREQLLSMLANDARNRVLSPSANPPLNWGLSGPAAGKTLGLGLASRRTFALALLAIVVFFLTPRVNSTQWNFVAFIKGGAIQTGFSSHVDLNHSGSLEVSSKVVVEVMARGPDGKPKTDVPGDQRWRGVTLNHYDHGAWRENRVSAFVPGNNTNILPLLSGSPEDVAGLHDKQVSYTFSVNLSLANGLFLAEPVVPLRGQRYAPAISLSAGQWAPLFLVRDNTLVPPRRRGPPSFSYMQVTRPLGPDEVIEGNVNESYTTSLLQQPVPWIKTFTNKLIGQLILQGKLQDRDLAVEQNPAINQSTALLPENRARIANALSEYLSNSGEFKYSMEMRRSDRHIDATEDFLRFVKEGHCEHYATALALMCRSVKIPARLVSGFRGAESQGEGGRGDGWYFIRESHAHTWVEVLAGRKTAGGLQRYWLTLDPTPTDAAVAATGGLNFWRWWDETLNFSRLFWRSLVLDTNLEVLENTPFGFVTSLTRLEGWSSLLGRLKSGLLTGRAWVDLLLVLGALLATRLLLRSLRFFRRPKEAQTGASQLSAPGFYTRLLGSVARHLGIAARPSQTALEFSSTVTQGLTVRNIGDSLAAVPRQAAQLFNRIRFSGSPPEAAQSQLMDAKVQAFDSALARGPLPNR